MKQKIQHDECHVTKQHGECKVATTIWWMPINNTMTVRQQQEHNEC